MPSDFEDHCWKDVVPADVLDIYSHYHRDVFVGPSPALVAIDLYELSYQGGPKPVVELAKTYPEYKRNASKVKLLEVTSGEYYGKGYQDVQNRVPAIGHTMKELGWKPKVNMEAALKHIFDAYRSHIDEARELAE